MGCINMPGLPSLRSSSTTRETWCRAPSRKQQASSRKQQATSFKLRQSVIYAPDTGMVIWSRAARELVSTIRSKPCEACIRGEAGGSSQQQKGKYDKNRQTKRHRRVLQRSHQDGHHQTPSGGEDLGPAHGHPERGTRSNFQRANGRESRTRRVRKVEAFQKGRLKHSRINSITAPARAGAIIMHPIPKPQATSHKPTSLKRQAAQGASGKLQACVLRAASLSSFKPQAASSELPEPCVLHKVSRS
jgi:hypothetical protein